MCIYHTSPDGFFWAARESPILLYRFVFQIFAAVADITYFSPFPGWVLSSSWWVSHFLESFCFSNLRSSCWYNIFHYSPDGFFWAEREFPILLNRDLYDYSQQLLMCIYFILPRMDSFEQFVSLPFSWIVMFFDYSQQLLMCIFHNSPDGFFWAVRESHILLNRYCFALQQLLM